MRWPSRATGGANLGTGRCLPATLRKGVVMSTDRRLARFLGTTFLVVLAGSVISELLASSVFSGATAETLESIADNTVQMRWSAMIELCITSTGIVVLAVLLYAAVKRQNPLLALVALGWWIAESLTLAISTIGSFLLIPLSETYVAGGSTSPELVALGDTLVGFDHKAWEIHMVFFGLGALIWYSLMYQSRIVPRWLSIFGLAAVGMALISSMVTVATDLDLFVWGTPTGVFELTIGVWLITKGFSRDVVNAELKPSEHELVGV